MKKVLLIVSLLWLSVSGTQAQVDRCGTMANDAMLRATDPDYANTRNQIEQLIQRRMANDKSWKTTGVITIPVVFHVLYSTNNATQNVSTARINAQLAVLNADYSGTNADVTLVPSVFTSAVGNSGIQFCLAVRDPLGNVTDGIIRKQTTVTSWSTNNAIKYDAQGGDNAWPRDSYLNIWVGNLGGGLLGYAQFPGGPAATDGVVVLNGSVGGPGTPGTTGGYNLGRTATHEVGHWLNLSHIWGDANCGNDNVTDTPTQQTSNFGCPNFPHVTCSNGPNGDMFMNYMDYTDDACMYMFTNGQGTRMNTSLTTTRAALLNSLGCVPVVAGAPTANFVASATNITPGTNVNFTDLSSGSPTTWSWVFTGATPASSNLQNPVNISYPTVGTYPVSLTVTNASGSDTELKTGYIVVTAGGSGGTCDTITNFISTATPTVYGSSGWGYVSGQNDYLDIAKADYFSQPITPTYQLTGALMAFGTASNANTTNTFNVRVWDDNGTAGAPNTVLGTQTVTYATATNDAGLGNLTYVAFPTPINITGAFYLGIEFGYSAGDTVALITTADGEVVPGTAWEQWSDNSWHAYSETPASWGLNLAHAIFPIFCAPNSISNPVESGILIYPNPTHGDLILQNTSNNSDKAVVSIVNVMGQQVMEKEFTNFSGTHHIDLAGYSDGMYFVQINTADKVMMTRIVVSK
jgi:PKD repeat protein